MRRSSSADQSTFGPLRVKQDDNVKAGSTRKGRNSASGSSRQSTGGRSLSGSRMSVGGRQSISTARKSIANRFGQQNRLSRGSGMGSRASKDMIPVSNKGYQHKCTQNILQFLTERGYPHHITPKILQAPSSKEFFKIFEFIYRMVCPDYKPSARPEEDIPRIFKTIGFPIMISRSSMFAIGSLHTWPTILAALNFMVEWINYGMSVSEQGEEKILLEDDDFGGPSDEQLFFKYLQQAYNSFMEGNDTFEEEEAVLKMALTQKAHGEEGSIECLLEEITGLENQLELLEQDPDRLKVATQQLEMMALDEERYRGYLNELETHRKKLSQDLCDVEEEHAQLVLELEEENAKIQKMQQIYEKQEFTQEDVERINMKRRELGRQREDLEKKCHAVDEEIWKEEVAMTKEMEHIESRQQKYNQMAFSLKLVPTTAENACGIDYEMRKGSLGESGECWDFNAKIKPALLALNAQFAEVATIKESEKIKLTEKLEQVMDYMSDVQNEVSLMESKHKRADDEFEAKKQMYQREMQQTQEKVEKLQNEMVHLNSILFLSETDVAKEKKQLTLWAAQEKERAQRKLREYMDFFQKALQMIMDHMEAVQTLLKDRAERSELLKEEALRKANATITADSRSEPVVTSQDPAP